MVKLWFWFGGLQAFNQGLKIGAALRKPLSLTTLRLRDMAE